MRYTVGCLLDRFQSFYEDWPKRIVQFSDENSDIRLVLLPAINDDYLEDYINKLSNVALENDLHVAGSMGGIAFFIAPNGKELLGKNNTDPYPVVKSDIGDISVIINQDICIHEEVRGCVLNGAEIILNPSIEREDVLSYERSIARPARAYENLAMVVCASAGGNSGVWDPRGTNLISGGPELEIISTKIDLSTLRTYRSMPVLNFPAQLRTKLYSVEYEKGEERVEDFSNYDSASSIPPYQTLIVQSHINTVPNLSEANDVISGNLDRSFRLASKFAGRDQLKLVVFPEYWMTGAVFGQSVDDFWPQVGIQINGPHFERLQEFASKMKVYAGGAIFEYDPDWPRRWFNTAFIINPSGDLILRYRKIQCGDINGLLNNTTPGNVYSEYIDRYGYDGLFPVVETELGRLAACICYDTNFPELWRTLSLRGAEVIIYPTGEPHSAHRTAWDMAKRAHAAENQIYIVSSNAGSESYSKDGPSTFFHRGYSKLIGPDGRTVAVADTGGEVPLVANIDIGLLRRLRNDKDLSIINKIDFNKSALMYNSHDGFPLDCFLDKPVERADEGIKIVMKTMDRYIKEGTYTRVS